ncbi:MAG: DUF3047 domain-containing protein [Candidatus Methylomirabilales bacterium]
MTPRAETGVRPIWGAVGLLTVSLLCAPATAVWAQEVVVLEVAQAQDGVPRGWTLSENEGTAELALVNASEGRALKLRSNAASYSLNTEVDIDLTKTPYLEWQWKVTALPRGGDFRQRATNDQAAQLLVVFSWGVFQKQVIAYIWDTTAPKGTTRKDPSSALVPFLTVHTVVVESGDAQRGNWMTERRNVVEDYTQLFGDVPARVVGIRIQINSQHTQSQAEAHWRSISFRAHP